MTEAQVVRIDGLAYDVSSFMHRHPGGANMLRLAVDRDDASILFHSYHSRPEVASSVLHTLPRKPTLNKASTCKAAQSPLYAELRSAARVALRGVGTGARGDWSHVAKAVGLVVGTWALLVAMVMCDWLWLAPVVSIGLVMISLCVHHDANHGSLSAWPVVNTILGWSGDMLETNDVHGDCDVYSSFPLIRFHEKQTWQPHHRWQWIYAPMLYTLMAAAHLIQEPGCVLDRMYQKTPLHALSVGDHIVFWSGKAVHVCLFFGFPMWGMGVLRGAIAAMVMLMQGGFILGCLFVVSHNTEHTEDGEPIGDWAEQQIRTSANWGMAQPWVGWVVGGLNYQIEHHLFPGMSHDKYPIISRAVRRVCKLHGIPYNSYPTFGDIFRSHVAYMYRLGNATDAKPRST